MIHFNLDVSLTLPRLDAHYDWLPSPETTFNNRTLPAKVIGDGCAADEKAKGVIAIVSEKNCDYFVKVGHLTHYYYYYRETLLLHGCNYNGCCCNAVWTR